MRILFCSHNPLDVRAGAAKVFIEVAAEMSKLGADCTLLSDSDVFPEISRYRGLSLSYHYAKALREYLRKNSRNYDVIDYDHMHLPFEHRSFNNSSLFVARSVLLTHHSAVARLPSFPRLRSRLGSIVKSPWWRFERNVHLLLANKTIRHADLVNVSNEADLAVLRRSGVSASKVVVIPFGLTEERLKSFATAAPERVGMPPKIAFVGTFDARKGGPDLIKLLKLLVARVPDVRLKLLGARYRSENDVRSFFPEALQQRLEIVSQFDPNDLGALLSDCALGVFPSYFEGFGFAVLEMLASALPVVAYDAPGPPMMLPPDLLVPVGNVKLLAERTISLLENRAELLEKRKWAKARAAEFLWCKFGKMTLDAYEARLRVLRQP